MPPMAAYMLCQELNDAGYKTKALGIYGWMATGVFTSIPSARTVNNVPTPVNNVITTYAARTGLSGSTNNFYTTRPMAPGSLIAGMAPSSVGAGDFSDPYANECETVAVLTDGSFGCLHSIPGNGGGPPEVVCGPNARQSVNFTLPTAADGYNFQ